MFEGFLKEAQKINREVNKAVGTVKEVKTAIGEIKDTFNYVKNAFLNGFSSDSLYPTSTGNPASNQAATYWSGMTKSDLKNTLQGLYSLGTLSKAQYLITLAPLNAGAAIASHPIFSFGYLPFLATTAKLPIIEAQTDQVIAGHYMLNHFTSNSPVDIEINFLETRTAMISNFAHFAKSITFAKDGSQAVPYDYLLRLTVQLFQRNDINAIPFRQSYCVALQSSEIDLAASASNELVEVPLTFSRMFPMFDNKV